MHMPEIKPKPEADPRKEVIEMVDRLMAQAKNSSTRDARMIKECVLRREMIRNNPHLLMGMMKNGQFLLGEKDALNEGQIMRILEIVMAIFISSEQMGMIKINDKFVVKD
jgi:hypothetical protein